MDMTMLLLGIFLVACSIVVAHIKDLIAATIVWGAYSLTMALLWQQLNAPDVAITEAAIGAGVTTLLLFATISKTRRQEE